MAGWRGSGIADSQADASRSTIVATMIWRQVEGSGVINWNADEVMNGGCDKLIDSRCAGGAELWAKSEATPTHLHRERERDRQRKTGDTG